MQASLLRKLPTELKGDVLYQLLKMIDHPCASLAHLLTTDQSEQLFNDEEIVCAVMDGLRYMGLEMSDSLLLVPDDLTDFCQGLKKIQAFFRSTNLWRPPKPKPGITDHTTAFNTMLTRDTQLSMGNVRSYIVLQFPQKVLDSPGAEFKAVKSHFKDAFTREQKLRVIDQWPTAVSLLSEKDRDDDGLLLKAVEKNGATLQFASDRLRKDRDLVLIAVGGNGLALQYADANYKNDMELVSVAVYRGVDALQFAGPGISRTTPEWKELVLFAVRRYGMALQWAGEALQDDYDLVLVAVLSSRGALQFASERLRGNAMLMLLSNQPLVL